MAIRCFSREELITEALASVSERVIAMLEQSMAVDDFATVVSAIDLPATVKNHTRKLYADELASWPALEIPEHWDRSWIADQIMLTDTEIDELRRHIRAVLLPPPVVTIIENDPEAACAAMAYFANKYTGKKEK